MTRTGKRVSGIEADVSTKIPSVLCLAIIALPICALFALANRERSWANYADQELTLAYNAILLLSGLRQELYDHTGFFTIYLLGKYIAAKSIFVDGLISNVSQLNAGNYFSTFHQLVTYSREFSALSIYVLTSSIFFLLLSLGLGSIPSLLLAVAYSFSSGVMIHFEQLRTELLSVLLMVGSAHLFSLSGRVTTTRSFFRGLVPFVVLVFAIVNKIQVMIYCLLYFIAFMLLQSSRFSSMSPVAVSSGAILPLERRHYYSLVLILSVFGFLVFREATNWYSIALMGLFFFAGGLLISNKVRRGALQGIGDGKLGFALEFGGLYTGGMVCAFLLLMPIARNPLIFIQVVNPSNLFLYSSHTEFSSALIANLLSLPLLHIFDLGNTSWLYIAATLSVVLIRRQALRRSDWWAFLYFCGACYLIDLTSAIRYIAPHYKIYSELILLLMLVYFLRLLQSKGTIVILSAGILVCSIATTGWGATQKLQSDLGQERFYCTNPFIKDWHHRVDHAAFLRECAKAGLR